MLRVELSELGDAVFQRPTPSRIVDASEGHVVGQKIEVEWCNLRGIRCRERISAAGFEREGIPVRDALPERTDRAFSEIF